MFTHLLWSVEVPLKSVFFKGRLRWECHTAVNTRERFGGANWAASQDEGIHTSYQFVFTLANNSFYGNSNLNATVEVFLAARRNIRMSWQGYGNNPAANVGECSYWKLSMRLIGLFSLKDTIQRAAGNEFLSMTYAMEPVGDEIMNDGITRMPKCL